MAAVHRQNLQYPFRSYLKSLTVSHTWAFHLETFIHMKTISVTAVSYWLAFVWLMSTALSAYALPMTPPPMGHRVIEAVSKPTMTPAPGIVEMTKTEGLLILTQPTYNCQTGAIIFNTTGGDGSPITYIAPGISRSSLTSNTGTVEQGLRNDPKPIKIEAMQNGKMASYIFDFGAYCANPPAASPLTLLAPTYDCTTGAFHFNTSGGNGTLIEYQAAPGITGWTTNPNQFVDMESRTAADVKPFTLMARQSGVQVTYMWNLRSVCPNPPAVNPLMLQAPSYDCATGAFRFNTSGGNGTLIEYRAAPGITGWTTNPNQFVDMESRTASDVKPFTLMARQSGVLVTYAWDLRAVCPNPPAASPLTLLAPTYDCTTGAFHFNTSGGNGTLIEYQAAPGITGWTTNPNQFVDMESRTAADVKPFTLMARQSGVLVTYMWNLRSVCPNPPAVNPLMLQAPSYDCATGAFRFNTSGGNGTLIEYRAAPGITGWTTNPNQFVDMESRTASDVKPFTLMARQSGVLVTYMWDLKATCGRARMQAEEPRVELQVQVLGNPVASKMAEVEIKGVTGQTVQLNLMDLQGRVLHQRTINQAGSTERVYVPIDSGKELLLLTVSTTTQRKQVKLLRP